MKKSPKAKLKTKWAALEALVGEPKRIALVAADLVAHFEKRVDAMDGKAMIVCMSRRITACWRGRIRQGRHPLRDQ